MGGWLFHRYLPIIPTISLAQQSHAISSLETVGGMLELGLVLELEVVLGLGLEVVLGLGLEVVMGLGLEVVMGLWLEVVLEVVLGLGL